MTVKPFAGIRPDPRYVPIVNVAPYDVVTTADVRKAVKNNPYSFFHVTRAEADIPDIQDEHSQLVYDKAAKNLKVLLEDKILVRDEKPAYYLLEQTWHGRTQTGLYAAVSCQEYSDNLIKKHELTRKDKEEDRTNHILTTRADTGPIFLAFNPLEGFDTLVEGVKLEPVLYEFTDENDVEIRFWLIDEPEDIRDIESYFTTIPSLYIADGHHRAASAVNVWKQLDMRNPLNSGAAYFMAVLFPADQLEILSYNRAVLDLNELSEAEFLSKTKEKFEVEASDTLEPASKGEIHMMLDKKCYRLLPKKGTYDPSNPLESLDVSILQKNILTPILGIDDPRTSKRIQFVGGIKGTKELIRMVEEKEAAAVFSLYPVSMEELMAITDRNELMPPKSTWFEPKLRDGLVTFTF